MSEVEIAFSIRKFGRFESVLNHWEITLSILQWVQTQLDIAKKIMIYRNVTQLNLMKTNKHLS